MLSVKVKDGGTIRHQRKSFAPGSIIEEITNDEAKRLESLGLVEIVNLHQGSDSAFAEQDEVIEQVISAQSDSTDTQESASTEPIGVEEKTPLLKNSKILSKDEIESLEMCGLIAVEQFMNCDINHISSTTGIKVKRLNKVKQEFGGR